VRIRALIADDEPLARERLRDLLNDIPEIEVVGDSVDGPATVEAIELLNPHVVFLDIQMPGFSGLEVVTRVPRRPHVIFTTAFAEHAVAAFELNALDYLLKPVDVSRLAEAVGRVHRAIEAGDGQSVVDRALQALDGRPLQRIFVRRHGAVIPVSVHAITRLEASGDYVAIHEGGQRSIVRATLRQLEERLDPRRFVRIHRSHIVNLDHVAAFRPHGGGRLRAELDDGSAVVASRTASRQLRRASA
jgi:two-component system LytT family response regulator